MNFKHMQPETKLHYRMYKDGKNWVFAAVALAVFSVGAITTTANADTTTATTPTEKVASGAASSQAPSAASTQTSAASETQSTASAAKSDTTSNAQSATSAGDKQSQAATNSTETQSAASENCQGSQSATSQHSQDSQPALSQQSQSSQATNSNAKSLVNSVVSVVSDGSQATSAARTQANSTNASAGKAQTTELLADTSDSTTSTATDATSAETVNKPTVNKTSVAADGQTVTISPDNFDSYFTANGSAKYTNGQVTLTDNVNQTGNITLKNQMDSNYGFTVNGGVSMELGSDSENADGISFIFHPGATTLVGQAGGALGIAGLQNSFGFKIDNYLNADDTNVHPNFYPDPSLDRDGNAIVNGDAFGAFVYTDGTGIAATYGGPNGKVYDNSKIGVDLNFNKPIAPQLNHISEDGKYSKTSAANDDSDATLDKNAGAALVMTPSETKGVNIPIKMVYEPKMVEQLDDNGNAILDANQKPVYKFEHLMTVYYGGPDVTGKTLQPMKTWSIDITPWLVQKTDGSGTYDPLSFAMAASTGTHYNLQEMNYESFRYVSDGVVNYKYVTEDENGVKTVIGHPGTDINGKATIIDETLGADGQTSVPTSGQKSFKIGDSYSFAPVALQGYTLESTPTDAAGFVNVLNNDVVFVYSKNPTVAVQFMAYDAHTGSPLSQKSIDNETIEEGQKDDVTSKALPADPTGYKLVQMDDAKNYPKITDGNLGYTIDSVNKTVTVSSNGEGQIVPVWYAPMTGTVTINLVNATNGNLIEVAPDYNHKVVYYGQGIGFYPKPGLLGYLPVDPNPQDYKADLTDGKTNYTFDVEYVPAPSLNFKAQGKIVNTSTVLSVGDSANLELMAATKASNDVITMPSEATITEKDNKIDDSNKVATFNVAQQMKLFGDQADNFDFPNVDVIRTFQPVPTANFEKYVAMTSDDLTYNAKPATATVNVTSTDGLLDNTSSISGGTLLGTYNVSAPETVTKNGVTYTLQGNTAQTGTYLSDETKNQVTFKYVRQTKIDAQDVDILVDDATYTPEQNFVSLTDETNHESDTDAASKLAAYNLVTTDDKAVNIHKVGSYPVTFTASDGSSKTVYTNVFSLTLKNLVLYVGDTWTPSDNFESGVGADGKPIDFKELTLTSPRISTDVAVDDQLVTFEYGDPVSVTAHVKVLPAGMRTVGVTTFGKTDTGKTTPDSKPDQPITGTTTPVTTPIKPVTVVSTPDNEPSTPVQTTDVPTTPAETTNVTKLTPQTPAQPVLTPTVSTEPTTPASVDRPWDPIELVLTDDDNGHVITTTEIQGYTGDWVYIGNMVPAGYHLAPGQSAWVLLNNVTPQVIHLVANTVATTSTSSDTTTSTGVATPLETAQATSQVAPVTLTKDTAATAVSQPVTKTTKVADEPAAAELPHTGELAATATMGTGLALLTGLLSLFGLRRKQR